MIRLDKQRNLIQNESITLNNNPSSAHQDNIYYNPSAHGHNITLDHSDNDNVIMMIMHQMDLPKPPDVLDNTA